MGKRKREGLIEIEETRERRYERRWGEGIYSGEGKV